MRALGVDLGTARCGLALSDEWRVLATPIEPLEVGDGQRLAERIAEKARELGAATIVVGYPLEMDGSVGPRAKAVERLVERLRAVSGLAVEMVDERLTTVEARARLREARRRGRNKGKISLDSASAAIILQVWLDGQRCKS